MGFRYNVWDHLVSNVQLYLILVAYCLVIFRGPLLSSYVIQNLSWQMVFWFATIPVGLCVLYVFFFVPEVRQLAPFL